MDGNNWRVAQIPGQVIGGEAVVNLGMEGGDWRTQLQPDFRQGIANKITETLKRHIPFSGQEGLLELNKIAVRFEEKIYTAATSQEDYLRKISVKMLTMDTISQSPVANSLQPNAVAANSQNPQDQVSQSLQSQIQNQVQQLQIENTEAPLDSSSQTFNASGGDWQEEIYQKVKSMNEMYFADLNEMFQRMAGKLQQVNLHTASLPHPPKTEQNQQIEKLKFLTQMLERFLVLLRINKSDIQTYHKEKLTIVEKQIINILTANRPRKPSLPPPMPGMPQSQQQQSQMHANEGQINSPMQPMNVQSSVINEHQNNLMHSSLSSVSNAPNSRQNMDPLQPGSAPLDSSSQTFNASVGDWQEEIYQKIKSMNEMYFADLNEIFLRMSGKLQQVNLHPTSLPHPPNSEQSQQIEKLKFLTQTLERFLVLLRINKNDIQTYHKEKIIIVERQIINILTSARTGGSASNVRRATVSSATVSNAFK